MSDDPSFSIDPPNLCIEMDVGPFTASWEVPLDEVIQIDGGEVEIIEATETGVVVENGEGETEHIDLRELTDDGA